MNNSNGFKFDDIQALVCYGHGKLTETCFLLLNIKDVKAAKYWLKKAPLSHAGESDPPDMALQIALSAEGLRALGVPPSVVEGFSDEFILGMSSSEARSRRLGDIGNNAPENWDWGGNSEQVPHILLLLYANEEKGIASWRKEVEGNGFAQAFQILKHLPTQSMEGLEPFGFKDGISQPKIDWKNQQSTELHQRDRYSNLVAVGEVVLGYPNEYGLYTERPLIDPQQDALAKQLPDALDQPHMKDFARNGSYLVLRQLDQDVPGFWQFLDKVSDAEEKDADKPGKSAKALAAAMVGRQQDGTPLIPKGAKPIPGIPIESVNHFTYDFDQDGDKCPIGAHIRRSNPRTGDLPPRSSGFFTRLIKILGFGDQDEDLIASTRFHRLLRRGRSYGSELTPEEAVKPDAKIDERGLQFICLAGNILRQFEFVQNAWTMSSKFSGLQQESDPLLGNREPLLSGENTDQFHQPRPNGPAQKTCHLPQFVTVQGGAYFFMPGLKALAYIATLPNKENTDS